jgi:hypothetical protein
LGSPPFRRPLAEFEKAGRKCKHPLSHTSFLGSQPSTKHNQPSTMSVTTTSNTLTYSALSVLADYEVHHSEHGDQPAPAPNDTPVLRTSNPPDWPTNYRRIPEHRPINRELDQSERRVYQNPIEHAFIATMFTGLYTNVVGCFSMLLSDICVSLNDCRLLQECGRPPVEE